MKEAIQYQILQQQYDVIDYNKIQVSASYIIENYSKISCSLISSANKNLAQVNEAIIKENFRQKYYGLDTENEFEKFDIDEMLYLPINYSQNANLILDKLKKIQTELAKNNTSTYEKMLIAVSPPVGIYYSTLMTYFDNPEDQLFALYHGKHDDKGIKVNDSLESILPKKIVDNLYADYKFSQEFFNSQQLAKEIKTEDIFESYNQIIRYYIKLSSNEIRIHDLPLLLKNFIRDIIELSNLNKLDLHYLSIEDIHSIRVKGNSLFVNHQHQEDWNKIWEFISKFNPSLNFWNALDVYLPLPDATDMKLRFSDSDNRLNIHKTAFGIFSKQRLISSDLYSWIFPQDEFDQMHFTGRGEVSKYPPNKPELYFKKNPEFPLFEYAATSLMQLLGLRDTPQSEIFLFSIKQKQTFFQSTIKVIPILVNQAILGTVLFEAFKKDPYCLNGLDEVHTARLILASMLINPEDGKDDNFILVENPKRLISIDNDHCFLPSSTTNSTSFNKTVYRNLQTKTIVYCLDEMTKPLPKEVYEQFKNIDVDMILSVWLQHLSRVEQIHLPEFVPNSIRNELKKEGVIIQFIFSSRFIQDIYLKFKNLQQLLTPSITPIELLRHLEPYLWKKYSEALKERPTPKERFEYVCQDIYKKSQFGSFISILDSKSMIEIIDKTWMDDMELSKATAIEASESLDVMKKEWAAKGKLISDLMDGVEYKKVFQEAPSLLQSIGFFSSQEMTAMKKLGEREALPEIVSLHNTKQLNLKILTSFLTPEKQYNKAIIVRFLDLRNAQKVDDECVELLGTHLENLNYLNLSGCQLITRFCTLNWPCLQRVILNECSQLRVVGILRPKPLMLLEVKQTGNLKLVIKHSEATPHISHDKNFTNVITLVHSLDIDATNLDHLDFTYLLKKVNLAMIRLEQLNAKFDRITSNKKNLIVNVFNDLRILSLRKCSISSTQIQILFTDIINNVNEIKLESLDLSSNLIDSHVPFIKFIENSNYLVNLNLQDNLISNDELEPLLSLAVKNFIFELNLIDNPIKLQTYNLCRQILNKLDDYMTVITAGISGTEQVIRFSPSLQDGILRLHRRSIQKAGIEIIIDRLNAMKIHTFSLYGTDFSDDVLSYLASRLTTTKVEIMLFHDTKISLNGYQNMLKELFIMKSLCFLDLSNTQMTDLIVDSLANNLEKSCLLVILLDNNKITDLGAQKLCENLYKCKLISLSIVNNETKFEYIDLISLFKNSNLMLLKIMDNETDEIKLKLIFQELGNNFKKKKENCIELLSQHNLPEKLKVSILSQINTIYPIQIEDIINFNKLPSGREILSQLQYLDLRDNNIKNVKPVFNLPLLEFLDLEGNLLDAKSFSFIVNIEELNQMNNQIISLNLNNNSINDEALQYLSIWIINRSHIIEINLLKNNYTLQGIHNFIISNMVSTLLKLKTEYSKQMLFSSGPQLFKHSKPIFKYLPLFLVSKDAKLLLIKILPNTKISSINFESPAKTIKQSIIRDLIPAFSGSYLEELNFMNNNINSIDLKIFFDFLPSLYLKALNLSGNSINSENYNHLLLVLPSTSLISLSLANTFFPDNLTTSLISVIQKMKLIHLDLRDNRMISKSSKQKLCNSISRLTILLLLIDEEQFSSNGVKLPQNEKVSLVISEVPFSIISMKIMVELLPKTHLKTLSLSNCSLGADQALMLNNIIDVCDLETLHLENNLFDDKLFSRLRPKGYYTNKDAKFDKYSQCVTFEKPDIYDSRKKILVRVYFNQNSV